MKILNWGLIWKFYVEERRKEYYYIHLFTHCFYTKSSNYQIRVWLKFSRAGGKGGDTLKTPSPLRTTFAFSHPLFYDVFGKTP